jgi:formate dehydrogenase subunit gamma
MIERYSRGVRWFHAATYITVLVLLGTGWWLLLGNEGDPSPLVRLVRLPDTTLHTWIGWALTALAALAVTVGVRAVRTFAAETLRYDRGDLRWFLRWPAGLMSAPCTSAGDCR